MWLPGVVSEASGDGKRVKVRLRGVIGPNDPVALTQFPFEQELRGLAGMTREIDLTDPQVIKILKSRYTSTTSSSAPSTSTGISRIPRQMIDENADLAALPLQNEKEGEAASVGFEDMITIDHLHEAAILHNLRRRFFSKLPCESSSIRKVAIATDVYSL